MPADSRLALAQLFLILLLETMHKDLSPQRAVASQRHQRHAQISQRELPPELVHQASRASSTIGHGYNSTDGKGMLFEV